MDFTAFSKHEFTHNAIIDKRNLVLDSSSSLYDFYYDLYHHRRHRHRRRRRHRRHKYLYLTRRLCCWVENNNSELFNRCVDHICVKSRMILAV